MIKDKIIQKRIKGKALAVAMTAFVASLFVPMVGNAAEDISNIKCDIEIKSADMTDGTGTAELRLNGDCYSDDGVCQGHIVTATANNAVGINVISGQHYIKLEGAEITSPNGSAIKVQDGAKVTLIVAGGSSKPNSLIGSDAGIYVSQQADLVIISSDGTDNNVLKVKSDGLGAGIGGYGINGDNVNTGNITIESGTIVAQGSNRGTGIGGSGFGSVGLGKTITINGGTVIAKGGDGADDAASQSGSRFGAPGIGHGNEGAGGNIVINGGNVTAVGGMNGNANTHAAGIAGGTLTSVNSGGQTVVISDGIDVASDNLSGLVWDIDRDGGNLVDKDGKEITEDNFIEKALAVGIDHGNICTVHNQAVVSQKFIEDFNDFRSGEQNVLRIPTGTSLRIPAELLFSTNGIIDAEENSTLINPDRLQINTQNGIRGDWYNSDKMNYRVSFSPKRDVTMKGPFVYKGEAYKGEALPSNEIFEVATNATVQIGSKGAQVCPVDRVGLTPTYEKKGSVSDPDKGVEVKDAGEYTLKLTYGGTTTEEPFEVEPLDISNNEIEISKIPDKEFRGTAFEESDFSDVTVIYKGNAVSNNDFAVVCNPQYTNVGDASVKVVGSGNFKGERIVPFRITPIVLTEENTTVTLKGDSDSYIYDGMPHRPSVDKIEVTTSAGETLLVGEWSEIYECSAGEDNYTDAGDINIRITPKGDNFAGECSKTFVIEPRQLEVISITPAYTERPYDGTAIVKISDVEIDLSANGNNGDQNNGILPADREFIEGFVDGVTSLSVNLTGVLCDGSDQPLDSAEVQDGENGYGTVFLDKDMCLAGSKGRNYTLHGTYKTSNSSMFILKNSIVITQRDAPVIEVKGETIPDEVNPPKFICNLLIQGRDPEKDIIDPTSPIYYYRCTSEGDEPPADFRDWDSGTLGEVSFKNLSPNSQETFYVVVGGTRNVKSSEPQVCNVIIPKYPRKDGPPSTECTLTASETPNEDGETYNLTVEPSQMINEIYPEGRYLYSLSEDGPYIGGDPSALFSNVAPKTEYTAYIKYAETDEYTESETGTPTNSVTTGEGSAQKPTVSCGGTTQSEGEIHFSGTASVSIEYPGKIPGYEIRYTLNGSQPTASSTLYEGPFEVSESVTVNAFVIVPGVASSEVTTVSLVRDGDSPSNSDPSSGMEVELQKLTQENTPTLIANTGLAGLWPDEAAFGEISTELAGPILLQRGYENDNITYADLKIKIKGTDRYATEEDFQNAEGGVIRVTVTMDQLIGIGLPKSYDATTHNFAVTHMFATGDSPGYVESIGSAHNFARSQDGKSISFDLKGTSPVGFGWADVNSSDPMPVEPGDEDPGTQDPTTQDPTTQDPTNDPNTLTADGDPNNANGDGTTTGTDAGTQGVSDEAANALSDIMPKTGDPLSFVPWIAAAVISVGAVVFFATRKTGKKKQSAKKAGTAKKK